MKYSYFYKIKSFPKIGKVVAVSDGNSLVSLLWSSQISKFLSDFHAKNSSNQTIELFFSEFDLYLDKKLKAWTVKTKLKGTDFQIKLWSSLQKIPYGNTMAYSSFAREYFNIKQLRAISANIGRNPIPIIYPCHRVVGIDGSLVGFNGGIDIKKALLDIEKE